MSKARQLADLGNVYDDGALSNRNLIINGAMTVAQRGTSTTGVTGNGYNTVDRFKCNVNGLGTYTETQSTDAPDGFSNSFKIECTTADSSPTASAYLIIDQMIEAQNLQSLAYGTSSAKKTTLSFWVKSNVTGTYVVGLYAPDNNRGNGKTYTINTANTWEYKTLTFDGDTTDGINNDNGDGLRFWWILNQGSDFEGGTQLDGVWEEYNSANYAVNTTADVGNDVGDTFQLTGVQFEIGDTATPFEHRSYSDQLQACRRYYHSIGTANYGGGYELLAHGFCDSTTSAIHFVHLPVQLRASPTLRTSGDYTKFYWRMPIGSPTTTTATGLPTIGQQGLNCVRFDCSGSSMTVGRGCFFSQNNDTTAYIAFDAEL